jgi:hypothetical protein
MKFRDEIVTTGVGLLVLGLLLSTKGAGAQQCSARTTVGRYVVICEGFLSPVPNSPLVPAKELATVDADASATFKSSDGILTLGGVILHSAVIGTGHTNPDCTGTITYEQTIDGQAAPDLHISYVVSKNGDSIHGIILDPGSVFSCHLTRISPERRSLENSF